MAIYQTASYLRMTSAELAKISLALDAADFRKFGYESDKPKYNAQSNLHGRSHYCEPDTLAFFQSRILSAESMDGGLLFRVCETSKRCDPVGDPRINKRCTVFDCMGTIVHQSNWCRTRSQADELVDQYLESFDVVDHYVSALRILAKSHRITAEQIECVLA